jgi:Domain of unknown function (DUF4180)
LAAIAVRSVAVTSDTLTEVHGVAVLECAADGPNLQRESDAVDLIGDALGRGADLVAVPVERLTDEFFALSTGLAGAVTQKFVNYRLRLAIVGDISEYSANSGALRDFVRETNRGRQLWFVATQEELAQRLEREAGHAPRT